jgi:hypothetical protein
MIMSCGLYYKSMMIVNDDSSVITKLETSLTDDARVVIYDRHMFIVHATECSQSRGTKVQQPLLCSIHLLNIYYLLAKLLYLK